MQIFYTLCMQTTELRYQLALLRGPKMGATTFHALLKHYSSAQAIFETAAAELLAFGLQPALVDYIQNPIWKWVDRDFEWLAKPEHHLLHYSDLHYPALLKEISDPPPFLFVWGHRSLLNYLQVAIVGSRNPTRAGLEIAFQIGQALGELGICVTSGLALGIDAASHRGALSARGRTVAVLGCGPNIIYPLRHQTLSQEIAAQGGAVLSEFPPDTPPAALHFPMRNRLISGLSVGTLVVEAGLRSGSLITARQALSQNREVFAIPGSIHNPLARGCHRLIQQGAKLVESMTDIVAELGGWVADLSTRTPPTTPSKSPRLDGDEQKLLQCVGFEATSIDLLVQRSQFSAQKVSALLLNMELQGCIEAIPGGYTRVV